MKIHAGLSDNTGMTRSPLPVILLLLTAAALGLACGDAEPEGPPPPVPIPAASSPRDVAVLEIRELGEIRIELLSDLAPKTVRHFLALAEQGAYDGTTFHRSCRAS